MKWTPQLVEITSEKEVVWVLKDWKNLSTGTAVQILKDGGIPETPANVSVKFVKQFHIKE